MSKWDKISLYKYQQIEAINQDETLDVLDKVCFSACTIFDLTEFQLEEIYKANIKRFNKLIDKTGNIFSAPITPKPHKRIGRYFINHNPSALTLGQYVELSFFLLHPIQNAHYVLASISNTLWRKNDADDHRKKADYFLRQPVVKVLGSVRFFIEQFLKFNGEYKGLFGLDIEAAGDVQSDKFNKRYGWIYSASQVAEYERVTLEQAMGLPIRQALNDLSYLKALGIYQAEQLKKKR